MTKKTLSFSPKKSVFYCLSIAFFLCSGQIAFSASNTKAPWVGDTLSGVLCAGNPQGFGPYDYLLRHQLTYELNIVEQHHFNEVKQDLDYTLRAWPNHHKALYSIVQQRIDGWGKRAPPKRTPAECYLERAIQFSPNDGNARMLYAILLHRTNHEDLALEQYRSALKSEPTNVQIKYNLSLLLVELKEYREANEYAQELYSRGFPLPGLKNKLTKAGKWVSVPVAEKSDLLKSADGIPEVQ